MVTLGYLVEEKTGGLDSYTSPSRCASQMKSVEREFERAGWFDSRDDSRTRHISSVFTLLQYLMANNQYATYSTVRL